MSYVVLLRRNTDGKVVKINYPYEFSEFLWTEGNWSCDCNRELDFCRAINEMPPESTGTCLGRGKYSVLEIEVDDDRLLFPDRLLPEDISCLSVLIEEWTEKPIEIVEHNWERVPVAYRCKKCGDMR